MCVCVCVRVCVRASVSSKCVCFRACLREYDIRLYVYIDVILNKTLTRPDPCILTVLLHFLCITNIRVRKLKANNLLNYYEAHHQGVRNVRLLIQIMLLPFRSID